jgi:2-(3-amino-3-carboxypropyl)histidine synthase
MKTVFIETKAKVEINIPSSLIEKLPQRLCLATTAQFIEKIPKLLQELATAGKKTTFVNANHTKYAGQILGCSYSGLKFDDKNTDAFLYIGDGMFHPQALQLGSEKDVFCFDPFTNELKKLGREWAEQIKKRQKGALLTFLNSERIGVLMTLKPGQLGVQAPLIQIFSLEQKFPEKRFYFLVSDTVDFQQLENFNFIQCFVNTACGRMMDETQKFPRPIINFEEILKL